MFLSFWLLSRYSNSFCRVLVNKFLMQNVIHNALSSSPLHYCYIDNHFFRINVVCQVITYCDMQYTLQIKNLLQSELLCKFWSMAKKTSLFVLFITVSITFSKLHFQVRFNRFRCQQFFTTSHLLIWIILIKGLNYTFF